MAGAGYKDFVNGNTLSATDVDTYLMEQTLMVFASATARNTALTAPAEGQHAYLSDVNQITVYDGTSWRPISTSSWTSYSPTLVNITLGTGGTSVFSYAVSGTTVTVRGIITLGTGGALTGSPTFTLPLTAQAQNILGVARLTDTGTADYAGLCIYASSTTATLRALNAAGTYAVNTILSATIPFTWGNTDIIAVNITYEAA